MHHGSMFSIQRKNSSRPRSGTKVTRPSRAAAIGASASFLASAYHCSVRNGSTGTPPRSP